MVLGLMPILPGSIIHVIRTDERVNHIDPAIGLQVQLPRLVHFDGLFPFIGTLATLFLDNKKLVGVECIDC
jgi:hypothetical protein